MATIYQLHVAADIDSDHLLRIAEDALGLDHFRDPEFNSEHSQSLVGRETPGFTLTAAAEHQVGAEVLEEWLGFKPKVYLRFRIPSGEEVAPRNKTRVLRATSAVLERLPDDAALVQNGDFGILVRRDGHLTLTDEPSIFYPEALAEIRVPYEFGRIPNEGEAH